MAGDSLKRPPAGYDPAHPFIEDIKRKDVAISTPLTDQEVTGECMLGKMRGDGRTGDSGIETMSWSMIMKS